MIHEAGALLNGVQHCVRCGYILSDYRNTMVPESTPPMRGWAVGASIEVVEGWPRQWVVVKEPPDCREHRY